MKIMSRVGVCGLCHLNDQELQDSHFLPAGVYRVIRDETQANPNPLKFNDDVVFQDSKQVSDHLLCHECEERLNKSGEQWFLAHCCRKNQFRLGSLLDGASPAGSFPRAKLYHADQVPKLNVAALTYFAASMFWRASAHRWRMAGRQSRGIALGLYEEQLRMFLMGEKQFPPNCVLLVSVPETITPFVNLSLTPYGGRKDGYYVYKLVVLGVGFHLLVGQLIPREARTMCFVSGPGNPIYRSDILEEGIIQDVHRKFDLHPQLLAGPRGGISASGGTSRQSSLS
jgi:hypothetical protein